MMCLGYLFVTVSAIEMSMVSMQGLVERVLDDR